VRPKQVEPVRPKQVEPVRPKQVEPVRPKQVEPVRQAAIIAGGPMEQDRNDNGQRSKPRGDQRPPRQLDEIAAEPVGEFDFKYTVRKAEPSSPTSPARLETSQLQSTPGGVEDDNREIFLTLGRRDGIGPDDVLALLNRNAVPRNAVCYVNVRHHHTFVGVRAPVFESALRALDGAEFAGRSARAEPARSSRD